jgi:hypothetical protein
MTSLIKLLVEVGEAHAQLLDQADDQADWLDLG